MKTKTKNYWLSYITTFFMAATIILYPRNDKQPNAWAQTSFSQHFDHIRTGLYLCPESSCKDYGQEIADRYDLSLGGLNVMHLNERNQYLSYQLFLGISLYKAPNTPSNKYAAILDYCGGNEECVEDFFLHLKKDVVIELENRGAKVNEWGVAPGWDPANDINGDGCVDALDGEEEIVCEGAFTVTGVSTTTTITGTIPSPTTTTSTIPARCASVVPTSGLKGQSIDIIVRGEKTRFDESTRVYFGCRDVLINNLIIKSPTELVVNITIDNDALPCTGNVRVITGRVNPEASANTKVEARIPAYYWPDTAQNGGNFSLNVARQEYQTLLPNFLSEEMEAQNAVGIIVDSLKSVPQPKTRDSILEAPFNNPATIDAEWKSAVVNLLKAVKPVMAAQGKIILGNNWYAPYNPDPQRDEFVIEGRLMENWKDIGSRMSNYLVSVEGSANPEDLAIVKQLDDAGKIQVMQFNKLGQHYFSDYYTNPEVQEREKIFALASYYLYHGNQTYFAIVDFDKYGLNGTGYNTWFDAITYDIGQPQSEYYFYDSPNIYNTLKNGSIEDGVTPDGKPDNWAISPIFTWGTNAMLDMNEKIDGDASVKITTPPTDTMLNLASVTQKVALKPHTTYTLSAWIKTENCGDGHGGNSAQLYYMDGDIDTQYIIATGTRSWQLYSKKFTTGNNPGTGTISFRVKGGGTAWFDNIVLATGSFNEVLARNYEKALILVRPLNTLYNSPDQFSDAHKRDIPLDKPYKKLQSDGTVAPGNAITTVSLRYGEAAILIPQETLPKTSSTTTTASSVATSITTTVPAGTTSVPSTTTTTMKSSTTTTNKPSTTTSSTAPLVCINDADCDDGLFCNGGETCSSGQCVPGVLPCNDNQVCKESQDRCVDVKKIPGRKIPSSLLRPAFKAAKTTWMVVIPEEETMFDNANSIITLQGPMDGGQGVTISDTKKPFHIKMFTSDYIFVPLHIYKDAMPGHWTMQIQSDVQHEKKPLVEIIESIFDIK